MNRMYTYIEYVCVSSSFSQTGYVECCSKLCSGEGEQVFRSEGGEEKRESLDSKLILLAALGYVDGVGNAWCCCTGYRRVGVVSVRGWQCSGC
jgi:hypothetical protein